MTDYDGFGKISNICYFPIKNVLKELFCVFFVSTPPPDVVIYVLSLPIPHLDPTSPI